MPPDLAHQSISTVPDGSSYLRAFKGNFMLSYLHSFHAGNHADILKHVTLLYVLEYLNKKEKPYSFFDTHSGASLYDLDSVESLKTGEAESGIKKLLSEKSRNPEKIPESLLHYISFVENCLEKKLYPGSPYFEILTAFKGSEIFLTELHPKVFESLSVNVSEILNEKAVSEKNLKVNVLNKSGWEILEKRIPPVLKRGAVLCDPSYEELSDYENASSVISKLHKKWSGATVLLWYPLLANRIETIENMKQSILAAVKNRDMHTEVLDAELLVDKDDSHEETTLENSIGSAKPRLYGSGMFVINPSWNLKEHLESSLPYLSEILGRDGNGSFKVTIE